MSDTPEGASAAPASTPATPAVAEDKLNGIGGWLILVLLGLIISPLRLGHLLLTTFVPLYTDGSWSQLTSPGSAAYHPFWAPLLVFETAVNLGLLVLGLVALWHFLHKSRRTPALMIAWLAASAIFVLADALLCNFIPALAGQSDPETFKEVLRSLLGAMIWIPYFKVSKRVKATFVR